MPLPRPVAHCPICGDKIKGRSDKIFCTPTCKAIYHKRRKQQIAPIAAPIISMLQRNWVVLQELYEEIGKKKFFVSQAQLNKAGFHTKYYTTSEINKQGKTYYYIFDYGWMQFSEKEIMIIKLSKVK